jgi:hypothetical protein
MDIKYWFYTALIGAQWAGCAYDVAPTSEELMTLESGARTSSEESGMTAVADAASRLNARLVSYGSARRFREELQDDQAAAIAQILGPTLAASIDDLDRELMGSVDQSIEEASLAPFTPFGWRGTFADPIEQAFSGLIAAIYVNELIVEGLPEVGPEHPCYLLQEDLKRVEALILLAYELYRSCKEINRYDPCEDEWDFYCDLGTQWLPAVNQLHQCLAANPP